MRRPQAGGSPRADAWFRPIVDGRYHHLGDRNAAIAVLGPTGSTTAQRRFRSLKFIGTLGDGVPVHSPASRLRRSTISGTRA